MQKATANVARTQCRPFPCRAAMVRIEYSLKNPPRRVTKQPDGSDEQHHAAERLDQDSDECTLCAGELPSGSNCSLERQRPYDHVQGALDEKTRTRKEFDHSYPRLTTK